MRTFAALVLAGLLGACSYQGQLKPGETFAVRELTPAEKGALTASLSAALKDPGSAQFKWMPVILRERPNGITDYCGLVNSRNSYGGYPGFMRFYAFLQKDSHGQFSTGEVRLIEDADFKIDSLCARYGYQNFAAAR